MSGNGKQVQLAPGQSTRYACVARPHTPQRTDGFSVPPGGSYGGGAGAAAHLQRGGPGLPQPPTPPQQDPKQPMSYGQPGARPQGYPYRGPPQQLPRPAHHRQQGAWPAPSQPQQVVFSVAPVYLPSHLQHGLPPAAYPQQPAPRAPYFPQPGMMQQPHYFSSYQGQQPYMYSAPAGPPVARPPSQPPSQQPPQNPMLVPNRYPPMQHAPPTGEKKRRTHALPIVDPESGKDVTDEIYEDDASSEAGDRAPPPPDKNTLAIVEEFNRRVSGAAKDVDETIANDKCEIENDNHISQIRENNVVAPQMYDDIAAEIKCELDLIEEKYLKHNQVNELAETPVVSAISNSPEIVPKQSHIIKQQKVIDNVTSESKKIHAIKVQKANKQQIQPEPVVDEILPPKDSLPKDFPSPVIAPFTPLIEEFIKKPDEKQTEVPSLVDNKENEIHSPKIIDNVEKLQFGMVNLDIRDNVLAQLPVFDVSSTDQETTVCETLNNSTHSKSKQETKKSKPRHSERQPVHNKVESGQPPDVETVLENPPPLEISLVPNEISNANKEVSESSSNPIELSKEPQMSLVPSEEPEKEVVEKLDVCENEIFTSNKLEIIFNETPGTEKSDDDKDEKEKVKEQETVEPSVESEPTPQDNEVNAEQANPNAENSGEVTESMEKSDGSENEKVPTDKEKSTPLLRYSYREDQWSPLNTSGKKCYDPEFLLMLRYDPNSKKKPENINQMEIVADALRQPRNPSDVSRSLPMMKQNDLLLPGFARSAVHNATPNRKSQHGKPNSKGISTPGSGLNSRSNIIHVNLSLKSDVKLNETQNAWKPARMRSSKLEDEEVATLELYKTFRSVLNKLTPQKFDTLISKVRQLKIDTKERLIGVIDLVFEKAIDEPNFSVAYALMCKELEQINVCDSKDEKPVNFRSLIIGRCQSEFEKEDDTTKERKLEIEKCTDPEKKKELVLLLEEEERKVRRRSVGNVRFIGELFKQSIITSNIILFCMNRLLNKIEEETLECLCKLLTTIGKDLEKKSDVDLQTYFNSMRKIFETKDNNVSSRIRFMLQDVIDLRHNHWVPRQLAANANPKTMDQIKLEVEMEQKNAMYSNFSSPTNMSRKDDRPNNMNKRGGSKSVTDDGWSTASSRNTRAKQTSFVVDSGKLSRLQQLAATPITQTSLQPSTQFPWGKGSTITKTNKSENWPSSHKAGSSASTNNRKPATETSNMYLVLDNQYSDQDRAAVPEDTSSKKVSYRSKGASIERSTFKSDTEDQPSSSSQESIATKVKDVMAHVDSPYGILDKIQSNFTKDEMPLVVKELLLWGLEHNKRENMQILGDVTGRLVDDDSISSEEFLSVVKQTMDQSSSYFVKGDKTIWKVLSAFIWAHMKKSDLTLKDIHLAFTKVIELEKGFEFLTAIFLEKLKESESFIKALWEKSNIELSDWMSEERVEQFLEEFPLKWMQSGGGMITNPEDACAQMLLKMQNNESRDSIKEWIDRRIGDAVEDGWFIRAITEAIHVYALCTHGLDKPRYDPIESPQRLSAYYPLLTAYVGGKAKQESECLFAIQHLICKLEYPQGITLKVFDFLWEYGEIITLNGFLTWETNTDAHQQEGKGVILKTLTSFFTLIKSFDESSDETASVLEDEY